MKQTTRNYSGARLAFSQLPLDGVKPWSLKEATRHRDTARQCIYRHDHNPSDRTPIVRENCGACVLNGYVPRGEKRGERPNYAGWARIFVEVGKPMPREWLEAELARTDNAPYVAALKRSIVTFGVTLREGEDVEVSK